MKKIIISLVLLAMLAGCLGQPVAKEGPWAQPQSNATQPKQADMNTTAKNESMLENYSRNWQITDNYSKLNYSENETMDEAGLKLSFNPALPMFIGDYDFSHLKECDGAHIFIQEKRWDIARLRGPNATMQYHIRTAIRGDEYGDISVELPELIIGEGGPLVPMQCESTLIGNRTYALHIGTGQVWFDENISNCTGYFFSEVFDPVPGLSLNETDNLMEINGKWVQLRYASPVDVPWAYIYVYDRIIDLTGDSLVKTEWDTSEPGNPKLLSVFIPRSSPIFEKLSGQSNN